MGNPFISVIVPVYNGEDYLYESLRSIKMQKFRDFECLVVDDGSYNTEATRKIVKSINDSRFTLITKENGGTASAMNVGLKAAKGLYFAWLSHDDLWLPDKLLISVPNLSLRRIVCTNYQLIDSAGSFFFNSNFEKQFNVSTGFDLITRSLIHGCTIVAPRELIVDVGFFDETLKFTQDYDLWLRAILSGYDFCFLSPATTIGRIHARQTSRISDTKIENSRLWERIVREWARSELPGSLSSKIDRLDSLAEFQNWCQANHLSEASKLLQEIAHSQQFMSRSLFVQLADHLRLHFKRFF